MEELYKNELFLRDNYLVKDRSPNNIAKEIGCSRQTVNHYLRKHGITKKALKFNPRESTYSFGKRNIKGYPVDHLGERRIIEIMVRLRKEGLSYEKIARYLNEQGFPTKKGKSIWYVKVVAQILNRQKY